MLFGVSATRLTISSGEEPLKAMKYLKKAGPLYILMLPALLYTIVFKLLPLYGLGIAFKDYSLFNGRDAVDAIAASEFVGLDNFRKIFSEPEFLKALANTFIIGALKLVILFPLPILLALFINEIKQRHLKSCLQTICYLPHFFSWVVVAGIFFNILSTSGLVKSFLQMLGLDKINFLMNGKVFRWVLVISDAWKETGFSAIVYIAAISSISTTLYEAAEIDGAGRFDRMLHVTLPQLAPSIVIMFILKTGKMLEENYQQILVMYNPVVYETADVIQTYVYRMGIGQMDYTLGVTVGLFNSIISFALVLLANLLCKLITGRTAI